MNHYERKDSMTATEFETPPWLSVEEARWNRKRRELKTDKRLMVGDWVVTGVWFAGGIVLGFIMGSLLFPIMYTVVAVAYAWLAWRATKRYRFTKELVEESEAVLEETRAKLKLVHLLENGAPIGE